MRIYSRVVIDIATGQVVEAESVEYNGPVALAGGGGGGSQTVKTTSRPSPGSPQEHRLRSSAEAQMANLLSILGYETSVNPEWETWRNELDAMIDAGADPEEIKKFKRTGRDLLRYTVGKRAPTPEEQKQQAFEEEMMGKYRSTLSGGTVPDDVKAWMDEVYGNQMRLGTEAIDKAAIKAAGGRGLGLGDTPIGDPYLRATADLGANLGASKAQGLIGLRGEELNRAGAYLSYMDQLKQLKNFQNPYTVADMYKNFSLGLYGPRFSKGTTTSVGPAPSQGFNLAATLGGVGGLMAGIGTLFPPAGAASALANPAGLVTGMLSSEKLKDDVIELAPEDYTEILETVKELPVSTWRYKGGLNLGDETHIGPTVENSPAWMRTSDGIALSPVDYLGTLTAAIKGLATEVDELKKERGLGLYA